MMEYKFTHLPSFILHLSSLSPLLPSPAQGCKLNGLPILQELAMSESPRPKYTTPADWDTVYREGTPPWDIGIPHAELPRVLDEYRLKPQTVLEIGCGTGCDAILMARRRFEVTAIDCSPIALERARLRAERENVLLRFVLVDMFEFARSSGQFDLVYDCGVYHAVRQTQLDQYLDMLWRVTRPGSYFFCMAGAPKPTTDTGPPQVTEDEIHNELGRLFEFIHLRPARFENPAVKDGYPAWSCLMQRPAVGKT
jgi:methyl halide transferase